MRALIKRKEPEPAILLHEIAQMLHKVSRSTSRLQNLGCSWRAFSSIPSSKPPGRRASPVGISGEGPPPPGRVTLDAVPKHLRTFNKALKVQAVVFDFGVMTRALDRAMAEEGFLSGFDPRHERFKGFAKGTGPVHGSAAWVQDLQGDALQSAIEARGLDASGSEEERKARLVGEVERANKSWVVSLLAREQRAQLRDMGLDPHGKAWQLQARLEAALTKGEGKPPDFGKDRTTVELEPAVDSTAASTAAEVAKALDLGINVAPVSGGAGFQIDSLKANDAVAVERGDEGEEALTSQLLGVTAAAKAGSSKPVKRAFEDSTPKGLPKELSDVTTKYRAAILKKTGGNFQSMKLSPEQVKGDAEALSFGRASLVNVETTAAKAGSKWMLGSGVGGLLEYLERRSMTLALLPEMDTPPDDLATFQQQAPAAVQNGLVMIKPSRVAEHTAEAEKLIGAKKAARAPEDATKSAPSFWGSVFGFSNEPSAQTVAERQKQASLSVEVWTRCLDEFARNLGVEPQQIVVVSDKDDLIRAARNISCHTIAFNPPGQRRVDASCDASVEAISEVKDVTESINGISYR